MSEQLSNNKAGTKGIIDQSVMAADRLYRKVAVRIIPIVLISYLFAFLDRINIGYAKIEMQADLHFSDAVYGFGAGLFFVTYIIFEVPSNVLLQKIGARLTFLRIMVLWGLVSMSMAFVTSTTQFYAARLLLGVFEAGFFPGIILYLSFWFPTERRARATGLFMFALPMAGVIGGIVSGQIIASTHNVIGLQGWQWLFLIEGVPSLILGVVVYFYLPNKPDDADWLSEEEKRIINSAVHDQRKLQKRGFERSRVLTVFKDRQVYLMAYVYLCSTYAVFTLTFWLPEMISRLGVDSITRISAWSALPYLAGTLGVLVLGYSSDYFKERRWHVAGSYLIGVALLLMTVMSAQSVALSILLISMSAFFLFGGGILFWSVPPTYFRSELKPVGIAMVSSLGMFGGFLGPMIMGFISEYTGDTYYGLVVLALVNLVGCYIVLKVLPQTSFIVSEKA